MRHGAGLRFLRWLARLLPADFRRDFGSAIDADLMERSRSDSQTGLLRRELPGMIATVLREHADALAADVKYALRTMRRTPGFTAMAILMFALGTGVNVAMFSVIDAVLLRSPFPDAERVVRVLETEGRKTPTSAVAVEKYRSLQSAPGVFASIAALGGGSHVVSIGGDERRLDVECTSASMFDVLGAPPLLGRRFDAADDRPGADPAMVLSYPFWRKLGADPSIVGSTLDVNHTPVTVVGVMPRYFAGALFRSDTEAWMPMNAPVARLGASGCRAADTVSVFARLASTAPAEGTMRVGSLLLQRVGDDEDRVSVRRHLLALGAAVVCVLLIACLNVGGLQLERTLARRRELAVRLALGASRARVVRQLVTENLVLSGIGALTGLLAARFSLGAIVSLMPGFMPYVDEIEMNGRALVVALAVAGVAGIVAGVLPLGDVRRAEPAKDLSGAGRHGSAGQTAARRAFVVVEVALSVVVLIAAALMIQTFATLRPTRPGFDPARKISVRVNLEREGPDARRRFVVDVFERLRATPGVRRVTASTYVPMGSSFRSERATFSGQTRNVDVGYVTPEFFDTMRMRLLAGRTFTGSDDALSEPVAIVNEAFAKRVAPDGRVLGDRVAMSPSSAPGNRAAERRVVGVVASTRFTGGNTVERPAVWMPFAQNPLPFIHVIAESDGRPESVMAVDVRRAIRSLRPDQTPGDAVLLATMVDNTVSYARFGAWMFGTFAALAVVLAAIGLLTTIGWWVRQRNRELGVRMALGATRANVMRLVGVQGMTLAAIGVTLGIAAALGATRFIATWLYGVTPLDAATFGFGAIAMLAVALLAIYVPLRRAARVDPVTVLKSE